MKCEIIKLTDDAEEQVVGTFSLMAGHVYSQPKKGYEQLMKSLLEENHTVDDSGKMVSAMGDPEAWFHSLPSTFRASTYIWARMG